MKTNDSVRDHVRFFLKNVTLHGFLHKTEKQLVL